MANGRARPPDRRPRQIDVRARRGFELRAGSPPALLPPSPSGGVIDMQDTSTTPSSPVSPAPLPPATPTTPDAARPGDAARDGAAMMATRLDDASGAPRVLATLNDDGSRRWLRPKVSKGRFLTGRRVTAYVLIALFTVLPHLSVHGKPMVLLDIASQRFIIFGKTFLPTDTLLLALLLVGVFLTIFFVTALFGRVWCGWACPQTVYMEFVFRPLERLFEGAPGRRKKGWLAESGFGKVLRPAVSLAVCLYLAHTFLAYFVGVDKLRLWMTQSPLDHPTPFLVMALTTGLMMFDFMYFREQTCIVACPYGRLQGTLLDRQSLVIGYDRARGEPRGKAKRKATVSLPVLEFSGVGGGVGGVKGGADQGTGDCVDCELCVTTCPTGIDIRNGLQMECIGCAQCIDACDAVMDKINRPRGLIRYSSQARLAGETARTVRARTVIYPALLTVIGVAFVLVLLSQAPANVTVLRGLGRPYTLLPDGSVENNIRIKVLNRTEQPVTYTFSASDAHGVASLRSDENPATVKPGESRTFSAIVVAPAGAFSGGTLSTTVNITDGAGFTRDVRYTLQGPMTTGRAPVHAGDGNNGSGPSHPNGPGNS